MGLRTPGSEESKVIYLPQTDLVKTPSQSFRTMVPSEPVEKKYDGPVSKKMWNTISKLKSRFPEEFDYRMYDRLYNRFGDNQPRGGVLFKTTFKLVNHYEGCSKCHYSFELDTYGRGCLHDCAYCYAKDQLTQRAFWNRPFPMPVDLSEIRKVFHTVFETDKPHKFRSVMEKRTPIRLGSMSDSFMWMDKKYGVTRELIRILNYYRYPYIVFTRSDLIAHDSYVPLLDPTLCSVQFSICGENSELTRKIEPGAPSIKRRFAALKTLSSAGLNTAVRINPLFPKYPDGYFTDHDTVREKFGNDIPSFPLHDIENPGEFLDMVTDAGVRTVIPGMVRLTHREIKRMEKALDIPIKSFFTYGFKKGALNLYFSDREIAYYYKVLHRESLKRGIRFTTCYIGNGAKDYFQYQNLWTNKKDCCDVVGAVKDFKSTSQNISWEERLKHAKCSSAKLVEKQDEALEKQFSKSTSQKQFTETKSSLKEPTL